MNEITSIRTSFLVASLLSMLWLAVATWAMFATGSQPATLYGIIQSFALLLAPVAALFAVASALGNREHLPTLRTPDSLEETESRMAGIVSRVDAMRLALADELEALGNATAALDIQAGAARTLLTDIHTASAAANEAALALQAAVPAASAQSQMLRQSLLDAGNEAQVQSARAEAAAASVAAQMKALQHGAQDAIGGLTEAMVTLEGRAVTGRQQSEAGIRSIRAEADSLFEILENTMAAKRDAIARQSDALAGQFNESQARLDSMAQAATAGLSGQLTTLARAAEEIELRLKAQSAATETLAASGERAFQLLDARLEHSAETSRTTLERLAARIQDAGGELARLTAPLKDTQAAATDLESAVKLLKETALQTADVLGETLPQRTVEASRAAETLSGELRGLVSAIDDAHGKAAALATPIAESRAALEAASSAYSQQRSAIEAAGQALVVELEQARQLIAEVEEQTRDTSLSAATRLVDAMTRVREVANQTTGTMRDMLDGLLAETRQSLQAMADETMRKSFVEPVTRQMQEAQDVASTAAERTASSMAALAGTLKLLEDRSADRLGAFETARQDDMLAASTLLTERLAQASVSITAALGKPMTDEDWAQWRRGERSLFNRRALALLGKKEGKALKALLASDADLAQTARGFVAGFEGLVRRFETQAPALASALQGSDQGRLAAIFSEALDG